MQGNTGIYYNGISDQPTACTLSVAGGAIHIYPENAELVIWSIQALRSCQWNGSFLILTYGSYSVKTLECSGDIAQTIFRQWNTGTEEKPQKHSGLKNRQVAILVGILLFIGLGIFTLFFFLPWIGEKAANLVPAEAEVQLGESIASVYMQENTTNDSANYYMHEFVKQLNLDDTYKITVNVIESREINAFALPGGKIFVYTGILDKMDSYQELVALLGHEVTHVVNRHSLKSICSSAATGLVVAGLFGDVAGISSVILSQAQQFRQLDYSRELETEADENGLNIMIENKVDPQGMTDLLKLLKEEGREQPQFMKYLSTHPDTDSRISAVSKDPYSKKTFPDNKKLRDLFTRLKAVI